MSAIVGAQLDELRALSDAYAPPLLHVGDAVPLRLALRLDALSASELAGSKELMLTIDIATC